MALRALRPSPSLAHRLTEEDEEHRGHEDQKDLVHRARDGQEADPGDPAQRLRDALIAG